MAWEAEIRDLAESRAQRVSCKWSSAVRARVLTRRWEDIRNSTEESAFRCLTTYACATNATAGTPSQYVINPKADNKEYTGLWRQASIEEGRRLTGAAIQGVFQVLVEVVAPTVFGFYSDRDAFADTYVRQYGGVDAPYATPEDVVGTVYGAAWQQDPESGQYSGTQTEKTSEARAWEWAGATAAGVEERSAMYRHRRGLFDAPASVQNRLYSADWTLQQDRTYHGGLKQENATPFAVTWTVPTFWGDAAHAIYKHYETVPAPSLWRLGWDTGFSLDYNRFMSYDARWSQAPGPYRFGPFEGGAGGYRFTEASREAVYLGWDVPVAPPVSRQNALYSDSWTLNQKTGLYDGKVGAEYAYPNLMEWTEPGPWGAVRRAVYSHWTDLPAVPRWAIDADVQFAPEYTRFGSYGVRWGYSPAAYRQTVGPLASSAGFFSMEEGTAYHGWDLPPVIVPAWARGAVYRATWNRDWKTGLYSGNVSGDYGTPRAMEWSRPTAWGTAYFGAYWHQDAAVDAVPAYWRWDAAATNEYGDNGLYTSRWSAEPIPYDYAAGEHLTARDLFGVRGVTAYLGRPDRFDAPAGPQGTVYGVTWTMNPKTTMWDGALSRETSAAATWQVQRSYGYDGWADAAVYRNAASKIEPDATWLAPGYEYSADWDLNGDKTYSGSVASQYSRAVFTSDSWPTNWGTAHRGSYDFWPYKPDVVSALPVEGAGYNTSVVGRYRNGVYFVDWHAIPTGQKGNGDDWSNWETAPFYAYKRKYIWVNSELLYGDMQLLEAVKQTTSATLAHAFRANGFDGSGVQHIGGSKYRATKVYSITNPTAWHKAYPTS